jgi:hypothetical protein
MFTLIKQNWLLDELCEIKGTQAFMMNHALAAQAWP